MCNTKIHDKKQQHEDTDCNSLYTLTRLKVTRYMECRGRAVQCIGFVFRWPSHQNVGSNPGRDRGICVPAHFYTQEY